MTGSKVFRFFIILLIAVFGIHQAISSLYKPIKTEMAVYFETADGHDITGIILRSESVVVSGQSGVMHFVTEDGSRVSKNGVIADIYDSESASITLSRIESVTKQINDIEQMLSYNDLEAADLDMANARVNDSLNSLQKSGADGNFNDYYASAEGLLSSLNRRQAAMGQTADFSAQLSSLKSELEGLSASLPSAKATLKAEKSGYFVSKTDGYEDVLKSDDLSKITPEFLSDIEPISAKSGTIGKIVSDYEWYIAAEMSVTDSLNYKEGDSLSILTSIKTYPKLPVKVKRINISENNSDAVVIFACNEMNSELASMRTGPMTVIKKEYKGLRVPQKALRVVDSKRGVYVVTGMQVKFVEVNVIFREKDYMICEKQTADKTVLRLYDEVVVKGKNLYDGKIIS